MVGGQLDGVDEGPGVVAEVVGFEVDGGSRIGGMVEVETFAGEAGDEKGLAGGLGRYGILEPNAAARENRPEVVELIRGEEPKVGLRLRWRDFSFGATLVEELILGGIVTTQDDAIVPAAEVADHFQVGAAGCDAGGVCGGEVLGESPKHAMHGHEEI